VVNKNKYLLVDKVLMLCIETFSDTIIKYDMIYLLTAFGLSPCGSNTHLHTNNT